jgi:hypothetical protein
MSERAIILLGACYLVPVILIVGKVLAVNSARKKLRTKVLIGQLSGELLESELQRTKLQFNWIIWMSLLAGTIAALKLGIFAL